MRWGDLKGLWEPRSPWSGLEESSMRLEEQHCECKDLVVIKKKSQGPEEGC